MLSNKFGVEELEVNVCSNHVNITRASAPSLVQEALAAAGAPPPQVAAEQAPAGARRGICNNCTDQGWVFQVDVEGEQKFLCKICHEQNDYQAKFNAAARTCRSGSRSAYVAAGIQGTSKQDKRSRPFFRTRNSAPQQQQRNDAIHASKRQQTSLSRLLVFSQGDKLDASGRKWSGSYSSVKRRAQSEDTRPAVAARASPFFRPRNREVPARPASSNPALGEHRPPAGAGRSGLPKSFAHHIDANWKAAGKPMLEFIPEQQDQWTMDYLQSETCPAAVPVWCDSWKIGGRSQQFNAHKMKGDIDFGFSAFFSLRLGNASEEFLQSVADNLSEYGQFIKRENSAENKGKRFASSIKSYTGTDVQEALQAAAGCAWVDSEVKVFILNYGAKMRINQFMRIAAAAEAAHVEEVGPALAASFAKNSFIDVGLEWRTAAFLATTTTSKTIEVAGQGARIREICQWGKHGRNFGGIMVSGMANGFTKALVYNKDWAHWRSLTSGIRLGTSAVNIHAKNYWMKDKFAEIIEGGLASLTRQNAEDRIRFEIRCANQDKFGEAAWLQAAQLKLTQLAASVLAIDVGRQNVCAIEQLQL